MCSEDPYMHLVSFGLPEREQPKKMYLVFSEAMYDHACLVLGPNCGYDPNKVSITRGYPKFDDKI